MIFLKVRMMINRLLIYLIKVYQKLWSSWHPPVCRFYPTCSEYSIQALNEYRLSYAVILIIYRLLRCHPLSSGGFDPLPRDKNRFLKKSRR